MSALLANHSLSRRAFLRGSGVALALPFLDAMIPAVACGQAAQAPPRRLVAIETNLGILPQFFFPQRAGRDYDSTPYLDILHNHRNDMTVFSGISHPQVEGGHPAEQVFLTGAPHPGSGSFRNSISLDQLAAERIGVHTRYPFFALRVGRESHHGLSFTRSGVKLPSERSPSALFRRMFVQGTPRQVQQRLHQLSVGRSILDFVQDGARQLEREVGPRDRDRLDQYFSSVRDLETQLQRNGEWEQRPRPRAPVAAPTDNNDFNQLVERTRLMFDMSRLALESDSTRLVTIFISTVGIVPAVDGVSHETHSLTHHGNRPETIAELRRIEEAQFRVLNEFLDRLRGSREQGSTLLDRTMVLYGTCMGSANAHSNVNLPVLLAGGGFRHGAHLAFDHRRNYPLSNLFVSMLQRLGLEVDRFSTSTGTMRGLVPV
jgi:Protein of unknown function (DUF1552)